MRGVESAWARAARGADGGAADPHAAEAEGDDEVASAAALLRRADEAPPAGELAPPLEGYELDCVGALAKRGARAPCEALALYAAPGGHALAWVRQMRARGGPWRWPPAAGPFPLAAEVEKRSVRGVEVWLARVHDAHGPWDAVWETPERAGWLSTLQCSGRAGLGAAFPALLEGVVERDLANGERLAAARRVLSRAEKFGEAPKAELPKAEAKAA